MTKLNIQGQTINVDDSFMKLSPEDQDATVQDIARQMGIQPATPPLTPTPATPTPAPSYAQAAGADPNDPRFTESAMEHKQFLRGVPMLGPALGERSSAAISALANPMTGVGSPGATFHERYAKNLPQEAAARQAYEAAHPVRSAAIQGLGGTAALGLVGGEVPGAARALGLTGRLLPATLAGTTSGATIGGLDALARGEDPTRGATVGALTGAGGVLGGRAVGKIWDATRGMFVDAPRIPNQLSVDVGGPQPNVIPTSEAQITRNPVTGAVEQQMIGTNQPIATQADQATRAAMQQAHADLADRLDPTQAGASLRPGEMGDVATQDLVTQEQQRAANEVSRILGAGTQTAQLARDVGGGVAGPTSVSDVGTTVGQRIRDLFTGARAQTRAAYGAAANVPATYNPRYMINAGTDIRAALNNAPGDQRVRISPQVTPQAQAALDTIDQEIAQLRFTNDAARGNRPITPADMEQVRKQLVIQRRLANNAARMSGNWEDARAVGRVMDGFDAWEQATAQRPGGLLTGDPADVIATRQAARAAHAQERSTFSRRGPGDRVGTFMENVIGKYPGQEMSPQKIISSVMGSPDGTPPENAVPILNHLRDNVFGANSPEWGAIKRGVVDHLTATPPGGEPVPLPKQADRIERLLANDRHASALFDAGEQARLQQHADNLRGAAPEELPAPGTPERTIADIAGRTPYGQPARQAQTGQQLISQLMGPKGGDVARALQNSLPKETYDGLKRAVLMKATQAPEGGIPFQHQKMQQQIAKFLGTDFARKGLTQEEQMYLTNLMNAHAQLVPLENTTNPSKSAYAAARMSRGIIHHTLRALGLVHGGLHGLIAGELIGRGVENALARRQAAQAADLFLGRRMPLPASLAPRTIGAIAGQLPSIRDQSQ